MRALKWDLTSAAACWGSRSRCLCIGCLQKVFLGRVHRQPGHPTCLIWSCRTSGMYRQEKNCHPSPPVGTPWSVKVLSSGSPCWAPHVRAAPAGPAGLFGLYDRGSFTPVVATDLCRRLEGVGGPRPCTRCQQL